ncbi:MAG: methylated-DNA--[protein]-cysteine S-methyltransferase [Crocinitomicaceae bacterium]
MSVINIQYYSSPVGEIMLGAFEGQLCLADWRFRKMRSFIDNRLQNAFKAVFTEETTDVIEETKRQLDEYFDGERKEFDLPLLIVGSHFQEQVWRELLKIPYGETKTYLKLSRDLGNEKAIRAVASANGANAVSIIVPCHRIIGSDGRLVGYAGGLPAKKKLLKLEGAAVMNQGTLF